MHCLIVGADTGFQPGNSSCVAQDCTFFDCSTGIGIGVLWGNRTQVVRFAGDVAPTIEGCRFGKCVAGLSVELAARPTVRHCLFHGCEAGIANRRDGDTYPLKGLGPYVDRCEFLRCQIAIEGPSRVTNSVFESNQRVFVGSRFGEFDLTEIDEFIRGKNLYWANDQLVRSDVPLGVDALFADPKRRGVAPETMSADELLQPLDGVLGLRPDSPGKGTASDGGDLGAFGGEGTVRTQPPDASGGPGLAIEGWLHIGPAAPDAGALSGLARDVSSHPRIAGDVDGGAQWAALEGGLLADPDGSKKLVAELPEARTLLATLSSDREGNVSLRFAWDGTLVAWWNGESLPLPDGPRRFRPEDATATVARRKGPNTLLVRHGPRATTGRLAVRVVDALGSVAPEGLSPMPTSPPGKTTSSQPIASVSWSIERGPAGKATGRGFLKIALANLVHWRDASNLRRYGLVDPGGKPADLAGADVLFQPKDRSVVLTLPRLLAAGAWKIKVTDWHRAFGEPFPPDPAGVTFRVP